MMRHERSAPIWLFSFVDLAFLLLIAFTQISPDLGSTGLDVGEIEIPQIDTAAPELASGTSAPRWQLRIYPTDPSAAQKGAAFELHAPSGQATTEDRFARDDLAARLRVLKTRAQAKPILAPHRDARAEDLLVAVGHLEKIWNQDRAVTVLPAPSVASGPRKDESVR